MRFVQGHAHWVKQNSLEGVGVFPRAHRPSASQGGENRVPEEQGQTHDQGSHQRPGFCIVFAVTWEATKTESRARGKNLSFKEQRLREIVVFKAFWFCSYVADLNYLRFKTIVFGAVFQ